MPGATTTSSRMLSANRSAAVRGVLLFALVAAFWVLPVAEASTKAVTGTVDARGSTAGRWNLWVFETTGAGDISSTLDWADPGADLDLYLWRRDASGAWVRVARTASETTRPETLRVRAARAGKYRVGVRAAAGRSSYTLGLDYIGTGQPRPVDKAYVTLLFSRSAITTAENCVQNDDHVARLDTVVAPELRRRGLRATGTVQTAETMDTVRRCVYGKRTLTSSWADLAHLRDTYGFVFVSHSRHDNQSIASLTPQEQYAETCGSITDLRAHGHLDGDGLFAWPNNKFDEAVQANVIARCFAFGRKYAPGPNTRDYVTTAPYWARVGTISGGKCNDRSLPCYAMENPRTYESPNEHIRIIDALGPGQWYTMQAYVLVTGRRAGQWNCSGDDWRAHWTAQVERYCYSDYLKVLDALPSTVTVTDPKSVAVAWGRTGYDPVP